MRNNFITNRFLKLKIKIIFSKKFKIFIQTSGFKSIILFEAYSLEPQIPCLHFDVALEVNTICFPSSLCLIGKLRKWSGLFKTIEFVSIYKILENSVSPHN